MDLEDSDMNFVFNGINEDSSDNFFIFDGIQTSQANEISESPVSRMECSPSSKSVSKENFMNTASLELYNSSGALMVQIPVHVSENRRYPPVQPTTSSLNVSPIGNFGDVCNKTVFGSTGRVMRRNSSEDRAAKNGSIQEPPSSIAVTKPLAPHKSMNLGGPTPEIPKTASAAPVLHGGKFVIQSAIETFVPGGGGVTAPTVTPRVSLQARLAVTKKPSAATPPGSASTSANQVSPPVASSKPRTTNQVSPPATTSKPGNLTTSAASRGSVKRVFCSPGLDGVPERAASPAAATPVIEEDKYLDARAVDGFVGNAAMATIAHGRIGEVMVVPQTTLNSSLRDIRKMDTTTGQPVSKSILSELVGFRKKLAKVASHVPQKVSALSSPTADSKQDRVFCSPGLDMVHPARPHVLSSASESKSSANAELASTPLNPERPPQIPEITLSPSKDERAPVNVEKTKVKENGILGLVLAELQKPVTAPPKEAKLKGDSDSEISVLQDKKALKESENVVAHTIEDDSDSDVCIVEEQIRKPFRRRGRGRGRPPRATFKCSECTFRTVSMQQLQVHEAVHPKGRKMRCSSCSFETRIKSCMMYHAAMHSGGKKFRCSKCTFQTDELNKFVSHESQKLSCFKCEFSCHPTKALVAHMDECHNWKRKIYACGFCPFTTSGKDELEEHRTNPASKAKCQWSANQTGAASKSLMVLHDRGASVPARLNKCDKCDFKCKNKGSLTRHMIRHHNSNLKRRRAASSDSATSDSITTTTSKFRCLICGVFLITQKALNRHHVRIHQLGASSTREEYQCAICFFVTDEKLFFENHSKMHSKKPNRRESRETQIFKCSVCDFETRFEEMIRSHLLTHNEDDSDFDGDFEAPSAATGNSSSASKPDVQVCKFQCADCSFGTNLKGRFYKHRSLHLRKKVFGIISSS